MPAISPNKPYRVGRSKTGLGLFATKPIKKGTKIVRYFGPLLDCKKKKDDAIENKYLFQLTNRWTIDGSVRENIARYINHACRPNAESDVRPRKRKVYIRAIKKIEPGEEINYDYGTDYFKAYLKPIGCKCAACEKKRKKQRAEARAEKLRLKAKAERKAQKAAEKLAGGKRAQAKRKGRAQGKEEGREAGPGEGRAKGQGEAKGAAEAERQGQRLSPQRQIAQRQLPERSRCKVRPQGACREAGDSGEGEGWAGGRDQRVGRGHNRQRWLTRRACELTSAAARSLPSSGGN